MNVCVLEYLVGSLYGIRKTLHSNYGDRYYVKSAPHDM